MVGMDALLRDLRISDKALILPYCNVFLQSFRPCNVV